MNPFGPALANHLLQSTLFAALVWGASILFRRNHPAIRHALWLAASIKFLVPFALLTNLGGLLVGRHSPAVRVQEATTIVVSQYKDAPWPPPIPSIPAVSPAPQFTIPVLLLALVWLGGSLIVLAYWWMRCRRVVAAIRAAAPLTSGREFDTLQRVQAAGRLRRGVVLKLSHTSLEPGVFGLFRPVLLLPAGISDRLDDSQLEAVIAHELCHVRRRDNLAAALHMVVECLFWFHPLVWWLGARLVDERERACDEDVLGLGNEPRTYAESMLQVCRHYLESPIECVAGITGANLRRRIEGIMMRRHTQRLPVPKRLLLAVLAAVTVLGPIAVGVATPRTSFTVAASYSELRVGPAKPKISGPASPSRLGLTAGRFHASNATLRSLIMFAYGVTNSQVAGGPQWLDSAKFDIAAEAPRGEAKGQLRQTVRELLAKRFQLQVHLESRQQSVLALVPAAGELKVHEADSLSGGGNELVVRPGRISAGQISMNIFAATLESLLGQLVVDATGLKGSYNFDLNWTAGSKEDRALSGALQQQLGLRLEPRNAAVDMIVIDRAEKTPDK